MNIKYWYYTFKSLDGTEGYRFLEGNHPLLSVSFPENVITFFQEISKEVYDKNLQKMEDDESFLLKPTRCSECKEIQFNTPSGVTCPNGHGGADGEES
jgi:hypothetical protein